MIVIKVKRERERERGVDDVMNFSRLLYFKSRFFFTRFFERTMRPSVAAHVFNLVYRQRHFVYLFSRPRQGMELCLLKGDVVVFVLFPEGTKKGGNKLCNNTEQPDLSLFAQVPGQYSGLCDNVDY